MSLLISRGQDVSSGLLSFWLPTAGDRTHRHAAVSTSRVRAPRSARRIATLLVALVTLAVHPFRALADSTGEHSPGAAAGSFTNASNAFACGGGTATATTTSNNNQNPPETYSLYGLSLPNTDPAPTVTGIQVRVRANDGTKNNRKLKVSLSWDGGTTYTDIFGAGIGLLQTRNFRRNAPLKDYVLGGSAVLWGRTAWSASELSDANFRVKVAAKMPGPSGDNINLDCIPVTVFYAIPGLPDLSVAKTASPDPVGPTGNLTYTITYSNSGQSTATNVIVSDTTPPNTTFVSAIPAPTSAPAVGGSGAVTWNVGSLSAGGAGVVTLVVKANATVGSQIVNDTYSVASDQNPATFGNPVTTTVANAVITLTKSASPNPVAPGGALTYTLTIHNDGSVAAANVVINEGYDGLTSFASQSTSPSGCANFGGPPDNDQWTIASFAAGATCTITITTTVGSPLDDGVVLLNSADIADDAGDTASAGAFSIVEQCAGQADDTSCNDHNPCTTNDACSGQQCIGGSAATCDDGNVCTDDSCNPISGCVHTNNTASCDDNDACTTNDTCSGSSCVGGPALDCNDHNVCTDDSCDPGSGCVYTNNTDPCDDGNACTTGDVCSGGSCASGGPTNCDDGNFCTVDSCTAPTGCTHTSQAGCCNVASDCSDTDQCTTNERCVNHACVSDPVVCDDHNLCTDDSCNPQTGCTFVPNNNPCDDNDACTTNDACSGGSCVGGPPPDCNDNNVCTDDSCDAQTGCVHTNNSAPCNDHNACTTNDTCSAGSCAGGPPPDCSDNNVCTDDGCNPTSGCTHVNNNAPCDDGNACTTADACSAGGCVGGPPPDCNDNNVCTDDSCDSGSGCMHTNNTNACNDGDACTTGDTCSGGSCHGGGPTNCDDGNACTTDSCTSPSGCTHGPVPSCCNTDGECADTDQCTTNEGCVNHACVSNPVVCNDHNPCTDDGCNPQTGCTFLANNDPCDDANACTTNDTCSEGACVGGPPPNCNDNNACTNDGCDISSGCTHVNNNAPCSDGDACTTNDTCSSGSCVGGPPPNCTDNNVCTDDGCSGGVCVHSNNTAPCNDHNACTEHDTCSNGVCQGTSGQCGDGILQAACGEHCDDGNTFGADGCSATCQLEPCGPAPAEGCAQPTVSQKALVILRNRPSPTRNQLIWRWARGPVTPKDDFNDPTLSSDYWLCMYSGTTQKLVFSALAPAGGTCADKPCWVPTRTGYRYRDRELTPNGLRSMTLKQGLAAGKARITVSGKGTNLPMPDLTALSSPVVVQMKNLGNNKCWEAVYSAPFLKQTTEVFRDKAD
jgi:uncharacterized repeat protein (TIGR01451 family)